MSLPAPYAEADDRGVVDGCLGGDEDAWKVLEERHGRLVEAITLRVLDEAPDGHLDAYRTVSAEVWAALRADQGALLSQWDGSSRLRTMLAITARRIATTTTGHTQPASLVAGMPTPLALTLDDVVAAEPARLVSEALERMPPNIVALVRLRVRGLDREAIAGTLGLTESSVRTHLERIAVRLGDLAAADTAAAAAAWRIILDAAPTAERVAAAVRTEDDPAFQKVRSLAEGTWRALRERLKFAPLPARTALDVDERSLAGFVDGTMRGAARSRVEGQLVTSTRSIDEIATLVADLRVIPALQEAEKHPTEIALAAACVATTRFRAAELIADNALDVAPEQASALAKLAQLGKALQGGARGARTSMEPSRVVQTRILSDEEAPLFAFEALSIDDAQAAARALDEHIAKQPLGARLWLITLACGDDVDGARKHAMQILERPHADPGLREDAQCVIALAAGRKLPREIVVERLRDALPGAVRFVLVR